MRLMKVLTVLAILVFSAASATAAGFRLPEAGAKAMGMGFAFTAQADDPSAIYFNPAGIAQLEGSNIMGGITYVKENGGTFSGTTALGGPGETQKDLNFIIPNLYFTKKSSTGFAYGIGIYAPFGLGQEYESKDTSLFRNQVTKIDLQTIVVNPTVAFSIGDVLLVGGGIDYLWGKVDYEKTPIVPSAYGGPGQFYADLEGTGDAWGYNFGLLLKATRNLKLGFTYRSKFDLDFKDGDFTAGNLVGTASSAIFPMGTTKATGMVGLPATAAFGVAYTFDRLTLEADADWTFWHSYKELRITNKNVSTYTSVQTKNWSDVCALRLGAEYRVNAPLALRAGFVYDPTPAPDETVGPELPDADRLNYMVGVGYKIRNCTFDLAYMYVDKKDRTVNNLNATTGTGFNGTWSGDAHLVAFDVGYKF